MVRSAPLSLPKKIQKTRKNEEALQEEQQSQMGSGTSEDSSNSDCDGQVSALKSASQKKNLKSQKQQKKKRPFEEYIMSLESAHCVRKRFST